MPRPGGKRTRRRDFLRVGFTAAALGPFFAFPARTLGSQKTLKIARWAHLVPEFDEWFAGMAKAWGLEHDTNVVVDFVHREEIHAAATAELRAGQGHDLCMFPWPPAEFQQHAIDHTEIYQTVAAKFGNVDRLGHRSTFNPRTRKYFAFADSWIPAPFLYFEDYWTQVNIPMGPVHYDGLRSGGKRLRDKLGIPTGLPFAPSLESNVVLHTLLFAFNSRILDIEGTVIINKTYRTITALKYAKALYQDTGTPEQLTWGPSGSVNAMLARKTSCTINGISLLRAAEKHAPEVARKIRVSPPLLGSGGMGVLGLPHVTNCSAVWNFAQNPQGAKQFLADLVNTSAIAY